MASLDCIGKRCASRPRIFQMPYIWHYISILVYILAHLVTITVTIVVPESL